MDFSVFLPVRGTPLSKKQRLFFCLLSAFAWGLAAHGVALVTKFTFQDELAYLFSVGSTVASGRWFLGCLGAFVRLLFGSPNFSLPLLSGFWILFLSGLTGFQIAELLNLRRKGALFLFCGLMVTFPVTASLFLYSFTAPYYLVGLCLTIAGASVLCRKRGVVPFLAGVLLVILGTAVYQSYISVFLCLLLLYFMQEVRQTQEWKFSLLLREILWYCGACIVMISGYLLSVRISTALCGQTLVNYKGLSTMGSVSITELLKRAKLAVYLFLFPKHSNSEAYLFPYRLIDCYYLCLAGLAVLGAADVIRYFRKSPLKGISLLLAFGCFPLAVNFIFVMCDPSEVYTLMQTAGIMPFLLLLHLADNCPPYVHKGFSLRKLVVALLAVFCVFSLRIDNAAYEKAELVQSRIQQYFTVLVAQIRGTPGYTADTPVAYIADTSAFGDSTFHQIEGFAELSVAPLRFDTTPFCIGNTWERFLDLRCGFAPPAADTSRFSDLPQVRAMPCYPDYGSIQMIDGTLVVKLTEP